MERENIEYGVRQDGIGITNEAGQELANHFPHRRDLAETVDDLTVLEEKEIRFGEDNVESENYKMIVTEGSNDEICVATDRYNLIQNEEVLKPVMQCIKNMNIDVVGQVRDYKSSLSVDIFPVNKQEHFERLDGLDGNFAIGLEYRLSHDKTSSIKVRPIITNYTTSRKTQLRVGSWRKISHYKAEDKDTKEVYNGMYEMTSEALFEMGYLAKQFVSKVKKAYKVTIDLEEENTSLSEMYEAWLHEDTPQKVVDSAVETAMERESDVRVNKNVYSMWSIVSGYTHALTNVSSMKDGNNKDRYYSKAKNALEFPEQIMNSILDEVENKEDNEEQITLNEVSQTERELRELRD